MKNRLLFLILAGLTGLSTSKVMGLVVAEGDRFHDWQDMGCNQSFGGAGGPPSSQTGAGGNSAACGSDCGMPRWWVSEPYINLCMSDMPLSYTMSSGKEMPFRFYYHQRSKLPNPDEVSALPNVSSYDVYPGMEGVNTATCGTNASWGNTWTMSITVWDPTWDGSWTDLGTGFHPPTFAPYSKGYYAFVWRPEGGIVYYNVQDRVQNNIDAQSQVRLTGRLSGQNYPVVATKVSTSQINNAPTPDASGIYWGEVTNGVKLVYPDGSQDVFGLTPFPIPDYNISSTNGSNGSSEARCLLTQRIDAEGRTTQVGYEYITNTAQLGVAFFRVKYVVDPDLRTNTFQYASGFRISEIDDPYGRKTILNYTNLYGSMNAPSSIVDAAGQTNSFSYQGQKTNGWITSLTTPYGATRFNYYYLSSTNVVDGFQQRAIFISEPTGVEQFYLYQHQSAGFVPAVELTPTNIPGQSFDNGTNGSSGYQSLVYRNTFHWGRRQLEALSANSSFSDNMSLSLNNQFSNPASSQTAFASALSSLTAADYTKAGLKHWLLLENDGVSITGSVSSERAPSPDSGGTIPGLRTWYNYPWKDSDELLGRSPQVSCVAYFLPDGNSYYTTYNYYYTTPFPGWPVGAGFVSDNETAYSKPDGSIGVLTNWFSYYGNSVDLATISNSAGQKISYGYNGNHQITAMTNALGQVTTLSWDSFSSNLRGFQLPAGKTASLNYYPASTTPTNTSAMLQQISITPEGRTFTFSNYSAGLPTSVTDDRGLTVTNTWDGLNRLTSTAFPDGTSISNLYNRLDLVGSKDRLSNWTFFTYDGLQHLTGVTNANNAVTSYSWCGCGSLNQIFDPVNGTGAPTTFTYDNQGNLTGTTFPDSSSVTYYYDLAGRMTNAFDGAGRHVYVNYDIRGQPISVATANGVVQQVAYDALGRPFQVKDADNITVTNAYDLIGQLLKRTWPDNISESFGYATNGLVASTNRDQKITRYARDKAGRLTAVTNANLEVTRFAYDSLNNITNLFDGKTNQTRWQYNQYGWLTNKIDGLSRNVLRYAYNANGWATNRWTPEKGNTGYAYDNVGNLKAISYSQQTNSYAFDALNRLTNMVDAVGTTAFSYTPSGRLQTENGPWASDTVTYTYVEGLRTAMSFQSATSNFSLSYGYDSGWRMTSIFSPAGNFTYSYGFQPASSLVTGLHLPNGANITNGYDPLARLTSTALNNYWGQTLDGYAYTPDALGLRTNILRNLGLTTSTVSAGFDNIGQLTSWSAKEATGVLRQNEQLALGYDSAHNLSTRNNGALAQTFTTDAANQLSSITRSGTFTMTGATPAPATNITVNGQPAQINKDFTFARTNLALNDGLNVFTSIAQNVYGVRSTNITSAYLLASNSLAYDSNGNLTNDSTKSLAYDSENQLTNITVTSSWKSDFVYDGLNRRRIARDFAWQGGAWVLTNETHYVYDVRLLLQERSTNNNALVTYTRGLDLGGSLSGAGGIGGLLARTDTNGSTFYHADGIGNITALIDSQENIVARYLYNPFGKLIGQSGPLAPANVMQSSSKPAYRGLVDFGLRWYSPDLDRWLNQDPIGERGGINLCRFVRNNPIGTIDYWGLAPLGLAVAASSTATSASEALALTAEVGSAAEGIIVVDPLTVSIGMAGIGGMTFMPFIMDPSKDPYLNPNGINASPETASSLLPPRPPVPPKGPSAGCPNSPNGDNEHNARGREAHKWKEFDGFEKEVRLDNGDKVDFMNRETRQIIEYKPDNPSKMPEYKKQLQRYLDQLNKQSPGPKPWSGRIETY